MKKLTRRSFTAAGILAAMGAAAAFIPSCNELEGVYGPPDDFYDSQPEGIPDPSPDDYDPDENEPTTVYGPPEDLGLGSGDPVGDYDPEANELVDVYGPPSAL